eukprot:m.173940 g.173940  ORF g.173940 m.173940 type:complete len:245 (+) comp15398_c0_seq4:314-1048(+)
MNFLLKYCGQVDKGAAYRCFCSPERLEITRKMQQKSHRKTSYDGFCRNLDKDLVEEKLYNKDPHTIRLKVPHNEKTTINDEVFGAITFDHSVIDDQVLLKSNKFPTYHLANVVDDHLMNVSHVLRGEEWISSLPKHALLYQAFDWEVPTFAHLPLLVNPDGSKLSKRNQSVSIDEIRDEGILPLALINFCAFLGWSSPQLQQEIYTSIGAISSDFSLERISRNPAVITTNQNFAAIMLLLGTTL